MIAILNMPPRWGLACIGDVACYKHVAPLALVRECARRVTVVEHLKRAHRASLAELDALHHLHHRAFRRGVEAPEERHAYRNETKSEPSSIGAACEP